MADSPEVKVRLTAEDQGVAAAIRQLSSELKNLKTQQEETAGSSLTLSKAFAGIAAAGALLGIRRIGKEAFDSAVDIGKMADKTGLSTQTLSVFHKVADDCSVSTAAVDKALVRGAKSITEFEQGSQRAAAGFALLGLKQKDFAGLNPDQKMELLTDRVGKMSAGFQKATAFQLIFSRGGQEMIPVLNALAAEGFDKATEATRKLGLLLDQTTTDSFRAAKASMQEIEDAAKGMSTQFEAGMLPAISDVADSILEALGDEGAGGSFRELGKEAGTVIRSIVFALESVGTTAGHVAAEIEEVLDYAWNHTKEAGRTAWAAIKGYIIGGGAEAAAEASLQIATATDSATKEFANKMAAMVADEDKAQEKLYEALFPSDDEAARRQKERMARLRPEKQEAPPEVTGASGVQAEAAKAQLALMNQQMQDELAIHRAYAKQTEQADAEMFAKGEITLKEYFDRRRAAITADTQEEVDILRKGVAMAQADAAKAGAAKMTAATPKEADRQGALQLEALKKVEELQTKITELQVAASTKIEALQTEEFKKKEENDNKILEFHRTISKAQGDELGATRDQIAEESEKMRIILAQAGESKKQIDDEIARYTALKSAQAEFAADEKKTQEDKLAFETAKKGIELDVKEGLKTRAAGEAEINALIAQRMPLLTADVAAETAAAGKTGNAADVAAAQNAREGIENVSKATDDLRKEVAGSLTRDFDTFFDSLMRGGKSIGDTFRALGASILQTFAKIAEQQVFQKLMAGGTSGSGGIIGSISGGFAHLFGGGMARGGLVPSFGEGGLIHGPGGPKSDSVPIRASAGEFVLQSDAVRSIGVANLEAINKGFSPPEFERIATPKFQGGGLVGDLAASSSGGDSNINLGIGLDEGLILRVMSSKKAANVVLHHLANNPKAAQHALSRSS
jgi:hypothetical protein